MRGVCNMAIGLATYLVGASDATLPSKREMASADCLCRTWYLQVGRVANADGGEIGPERVCARTQGSHTTSSGMVEYTYSSTNAHP